MMARRRPKRIQGRLWASTVPPYVPRDEDALDDYFQRKVESSGALTYIGDRTKGWPDYFVFWYVTDPSKYVSIRPPIELVELKDELGSLEPMQEVVHERLHRRGHRVWVLCGREQVDRWLKLRGVDIS